VSLQLFAFFKAVRLLIKFKRMEFARSRRIQAQPQINGTNDGKKSK
jgi:hypothetical protein